MTRQNIAAFTALNSEYPAFINVSKLPDGNFSVTVRSQGGNGQCGDIAEIIMSKPDFDLLLLEIEHGHLDRGTKK